MHLPPRGHVVSGPTPPGPRPLRVAARSAGTTLTLLAVTAAVAVWSVVQLAQHTPPPRPAPQSAAAAPRTTPATGDPTTGTPTNTPAGPGQARGSGGGERLGRPPRHAAQAPPGPGKARPRPHRQPRGTRPAAPSWIKAECARRFPDATRRRACVKYLQQTLAP